MLYGLWILYEQKEERAHLKQLFSFNKTINTVLVLKAKLRQILYYQSRS